MTFSILMSAALLTFFVLLVEPLDAVVRRRPRVLSGGFLLAALAVTVLAWATGTHTWSVSVVTGGCLGVALAGAYQAAELRHTQLR